MYVGVISLNSCSPQPTATKITGKADVGFVKDNKSTRLHQRVKAITASVPTITPGEMIDGEMVVKRGSFIADEDRPITKRTGIADIAVCFGSTC